MFYLVGLVCNGGRRFTRMNRLRARRFTPAGSSRQYRSNRPAAEFSVGSSAQGRPRPRSRRARRASAPPPASRCAAPRCIGRGCVVHPPTRVKPFLDRTQASLVTLHRSGPGLCPRTMSRAKPTVVRSIQLQIRKPDDAARAFVSCNLHKDCRMVSSVPRNCFVTNPRLTGKYLQASAWSFPLRF